MFSLKFATQLCLLVPMTHNPTSWMNTVGCDKVVVKSCRTYDFCGMELDGTRSDSYDVLEKDNIIREHYFENRKSNHLTWVYEQSIIT